MYMSNAVYDVFRCCVRMPSASLSKLPAAARQFVSHVFSLLSSSQTTSSSNEKRANFSTPQANRRNKVEDRRMSENSGSNVIVQIHTKSIEKWEPNVREKELLRRTWSDEFDFLYDLGSAIYCYIFDHNPHCKQLFPFIANYEGDAWKHSKEFRTQALKFVQTLAHVVKNIYHMDRVEPYLYAIGQRHCRFAERGFKHEYWDIFQDAMEHALEARMKSLTSLDITEKEEAVKVWRTLALYTVVHMRAGYLDGLQGINRFPPLV
ncbi:unnamed protein product [Caenorhabditis auriculariae]|uniref:Globin domain-containing protein n=1 Tax=Caenorhabditis auriculariae TaxID=2777116 RepID=A0A8S1GLU2_9PELO|nr:unnamed protein product [Caenorhabditis auriculariae]